MSVISNNQLAGASGQGGSGYQIDRSLRFNSADSAYLGKTFSSAGSTTTWTLSFWIKRVKSGGTQNVFMSYNGSSIAEADYANIEFNNSDQLSVGYAYGAYKRTDRVFRDFSSWYHIVIRLETGNSTASDRVQIYVNGVKETSFAATHDPDSGQSLAWNKAHIHRIASEYNQFYANCYLAEMHFVDGTAHDADSFGEFDSNNVWQPKDCKDDLTYGTNGFYLKFADNSSNSALGTDSSGNSNTWTVNNLSVASGAGNDSLIDTPTNYESATGVNNGGNHATLNPLHKGSNSTLSNGNLSLVNTGWSTTVSTIGMSSGKWYAEVTLTGTITYPAFGVSSLNGAYVTSYFGQLANSFVWFSYSGGGLYTANNYINRTGDWNVSSSAGDVIGLALDMDNGTLKYYRNGSLLGGGNAFTGITGTQFFATCGYSQTENWNFGQRAFAYPVSGYKSLCTTNLPDPTIADGSTAFDIALYTGNATARSITGLGFSPDLVWIKNRSNSAGYFHALMDTVRGNTKILSSNSDNAEDTRTAQLTSFDSNGFSLGDNSDSGSYVNRNNDTYVGWAWDAGTSTVSNTDGSITSQVRASQTNGISILSYVGTSAVGTIGHGLNAQPQFVVLTNRDKTASGYRWYVQHVGIGLGSGRLSLNETFSNSTSNATNYWNATAPTNSVVHIGASNLVNNSGDDHIMYCFAPVEGFSAMGSYVGNGSADGPFVYTGFKIRWLMIKGVSSTGGSQSYSSWLILDTKRDSFNVSNSTLWANLAAQEDKRGDGSTAAAASVDVDILSNGFKIKQGNVETNRNAITYIYVAFAENPFSLNGGLAR